MTTYYKDFKVTDRLPKARALEYASNFATQRNTLGHNVRRVKLEEEEGVVYRVYFSPSPINLKDAVHA